MLVGQVLENQYQIEKYFKKGGMGDIYLASDLYVKSRKCIVKTASCPACVNPAEFNRLFKEEAKLLSTLKHEQIPCVYSVSELNNSPYLVLEFIEGETLADKLEKQGVKPISGDLAIDWVIKICRVLHYLHEKKIVFRDIKPDNIIINDCHDVYLIDFGIASVLGKQQQAWGTVGYAAPEVYQKKADTRADIFSLGAVLHYLLTGENPQNKAPSFVFDTSKVPEHFRSIITKATALDVEQRYQSVISLQSDLSKVCRLSMRSSLRECPLCGEIIFEGLYFCSECGRQLPLGKTAGSSSSLPEIKINILPATAKKLKEKKFNSFKESLLLYQAENFSRALGFDTLLTVDNNNIEEMDHQLKVVRKALKEMRGKAVLADEVGLGKTIEAGIIMQELKARGLVRSVLVVVPAHLRFQWKEELEDKFSEKFLVYPEDKADFMKDNYVIISIDSAKKRGEEITGRHWDLLIADEVHYAKNRYSERYKFLKSIAKSYVLLLTATPIHNSLEEVYNLITLLKPGQLGTPSMFKNEYIEKKNPRQPKNPVALKKLLYEVMIRTRRKDAMIKFPRREANTRLVDLFPEEARLYEDTTGFIRKIAGYSPKDLRFVLITLQQRLCSSTKAIAESLKNLLARHSYYLNEQDKALLQEQCLLAVSITKNAKMEELLKVVGMLKEKVVVFSDHVPTQNYIVKTLQTNGFNTAFYSGDSKDKEKAVREFAGGGDVLVVAKAGSEGLNLQHYSRFLVNYDLPWNPMKIEQRIGRLQRLGQKRDVEVFNLCARGTIEEYVMQILEEKIQLFYLTIGQLDIILGDKFAEEGSFEELIWKRLISSNSGFDLQRELETLGDEICSQKKNLEMCQNSGDFFSLLEE